MCCKAHSRLLRSWIGWPKDVCQPSCASFSHRDGEFVPAQGMGVGGRRAEQRLGGGETGQEDDVPGGGGISLGNLGQILTPSPIGITWGAWICTCEIAGAVTSNPIVLASM